MTNDERNPNDECRISTSLTRVGVSKRKRLVRVLFMGLLMAVLALGVAWQLSWRSPPHFTEYGAIELAAPIMTADEYDRVINTHPRPYIVELSSVGGSVMLYGASHTQDPADPQIADLRGRWEAFEPTIALVEGRPGAPLAALWDPVEQFGEAGLVYELARRNSAPLYSWELPMEAEVAHVLGSHPAEQVALFYVLRPYFSNVRHGKPDDPEEYVEEFRRKRTRIAGLENTLTSVADIDSIWQRDFADLPDWRDTSDAYGLPGYLHEVWKTSNARRDEHFARVIVHFVRAGERVFAVAGSSHAVKLDPALRATLTSE
jgi:hypothetical protein